ncbi:helix-turn-helix domain-containing protein [Nonomuraea africana]|uniref:DNA-binding transcriptional ArsR family regulator n=1 Tax=Nonomuraea africana TaxID=46171 RepID=A0ABR9KXX8_9ACTN|nr:helix-turn-helix domain-containing protein [Nonomuraea africana]MBE1566412.1 DNA-binding transcriptional ArsR family regulator [Nonomuraea africana]
MSEDSHQPLSDPKAMRAVAHPARLAMINFLGRQRTATATELAEVVGVTPSAASYHLRMLAKYGFVEDAPPRGDGRERVWQAVREGMSIDRKPQDAPLVREAKEHLVDMILADSQREIRRGMAALDTEPEEWRDVSNWRRAYLVLTAAETAELRERMEELIQPYLALRRTDPPEGARQVVANISLFPLVDPPRPGLPTEDHDAR